MWTEGLNDGHTTHFLYDIVFTLVETSSVMVPRMVTLFNTNDSCGNDLTETPKL